MKYDQLTGIYSYHKLLDNVLIGVWKVLKLIQTCWSNPTILLGKKPISNQMDIKLIALIKEVQNFYTRLKR
jgi:hypothetical protein